MNIFKKVSLLVRSTLSTERDDELPPTATIKYPQVEIDRANRSSSANSTNAQQIDEASIEVNTASLREKVLNNLTDDELNNLCLDMNVEWEKLEGGKGRKVMELMAIAQRSGRLSLLIELCQLAKPEINWTRPDLD